MGVLIFIIIFLFLAFGLYAWYVNSDSIDDRDNNWFIFERQSGPFYWREKWMKYEDQKEVYDKLKNEAVGRKPAQDGDLLEKAVGNIRVKQRYEDWDDTLPDTNTVSARVTLLELNLAALAKRVRELEGTKDE